MVGPAVGEHGFGHGGGGVVKKKKKGTLETQTNNEKTEVKAFFYCNLIPCYSVDFTRDLVNREPLEQTN